MNSEYYEMMMKAGYTEKTEMFKKVERVLDREKKAFERDVRRREVAGIVFNNFSSFCDEEGESIDCFEAEVDLEEEVIHKIEIERLHKCLTKLPEDDQAFLMRIFSSDRGELMKISQETGINHSTLSCRKRKLLSVLKKMMEEEN